MSFTMQGHESAPAVSGTNAGDFSSPSGNGVTQNAASTPLRAAKRGAKGKGPLAPKPARVEKKSTPEDRAYLYADYSTTPALPKNKATGEQWDLFDHIRTTKEQ